jgi:asparagine synthase (glutamine-hydrolysing)
MCGILGFYAYNSKNISIHEFNNFVDSLSHRGPDGRGIYQDTDTRLFLGHRRLKILDLSENGYQPMSYLNNRYHLTFNGEIYNFLELKKELKIRGYQFKSDTDAEIILASYVEWGKKCLDKFNGMWAFAIWDKSEKKLFFSRDRFGIKPFYYLHNHNFFAFSSELKAFLSLPLKINLNTQEISNSINYSSLVETKKETILQNVFKLLPGHFGIFSSQKKLKITKWWETKEHKLEIPKLFEEQVEHFHYLLKDACRLRMRSDVPFGTALSGGLDSSSILALIDRIRNSKNISKDRHPSNLNAAFVINYVNSSQSEIKYAEHMIQYLKPNSFIQHVTSADIIKHFDEVLFSIEGVFDLPIGPWLVYRNFRKNGYFISIDGHGADEILGGYHHHVEKVLLNSIFSFLNFKKFSQIKKIMSEIATENSPFHNRSFSEIFKASIKQKVKNNFALYRLINFFYSKLKNQEFSQWFLKKPDICFFFRSKNLKDELDRDFHQTTLPIILKNFDSVSMAHGIEIRCPFLDSRVVTYAHSLPEASLISKGYTKRILRESMKGILPEKIRLRKSKIGFASPIIKWYNSDFKNFVLDNLNSQQFLESDIWDGKRILDFVLNCYSKNDFIGARKSLEFIQANRLISLFKQKSCNPCNKF